MPGPKSKITYITIGIRIKRSFRMEDIAGNMIDDILNAEGSPFSDKTFPAVESSHLQKRLFNEETGEYLRINTDDIILNVRVERNFDVKIEWIKTDVLGYLGEHLFKKFDIKNIQRFGILFSHELKSSIKLRESITQLLTEASVKKPDRIDISFSKKDTAVEGLLRSGVDDFKNKIYTLRESDEKIEASLDCQYYYTPLMEDLRDCFIDKIINDSVAYLEKDFYPWLQKYEPETA